VGEPQAVRRRRRGRRRREGARTETAASQPEPKRETRAEEPAAWRWLTFPVYFAFVAGAFVILLVAPRPNTSLYTVLFLVFLGATLYGIAHMATRWLIARRRQR